MHAAAVLYRSARLLTEIKRHALGVALLEAAARCGNRIGGHTRHGRELAPGAFGVHVPYAAV